MRYACARPTKNHAAETEAFRVLRNYLPNTACAYPITPRFTDMTAEKEPNRNPSGFCALSSQTVYEACVATRICIRNLRRILRTQCTPHASRLAWAPVIYDEFYQNSPRGMCCDSHGQLYFTRNSSWTAHGQLMDSSWTAHGQLYFTGHSRKRARGR